MRFPLLLYVYGIWIWLGVVVVSQALRRKHTMGNIRSEQRFLV